MSSRFDEAALTLFDLGWQPIPLPVDRKFPPPTGFTGWTGQAASRADIGGWIAEGVYETASQATGEVRQTTVGNVGIRLSDGELGIDVDHYANKRGADTISAAEAELGCELPQTWVVTSKPRTDSGIRLYRVPKGRKWRNLPDVDMIHHGHRYVVAAPSIHPDGSPYVWVSPEGEVGAAPPSPHDLTELPPAWVEHLDAGEGGGSEKVAADDATVTKTLAGMRKGAPCVHITEASRLAFSGESRHDSYLKAVAGVVRYGRFGCPGAAAMVDRLRKCFLGEVVGNEKGDRSPAQAASEWHRNLIGAVGLVQDISQGEKCSEVAAWTSDFDSSEVRRVPETDDSGPMDEPSSWDPQPLDDILDGTYEPEVGTLMRRSDGIGLIYPGHTHDLHGESESGKSLIIQAEAAHILNTGGTVAYIDFESDRASVARRLLDLGADRERIRSGFVYVRPEESPGASLAASKAWDGLLARQWTMVVLDGVTEALALLAGKDSGGDPNERIAAFQKHYPTRIANETGAAVVSIDHVTKSSEGRGRHALGGQHKMNGLSGASYVVAVESQPQRGKVGVLLLRIAKDRPAGIRPHCGEFRADRTQLAARVVVDSTSALTLTLEPPGTSASPNDWQPTHAMEKCSRLLESLAEPISTTRIVDEVGMRKATVVAALTALTDGSYVTRTTGAHGAILYQHRQVFREQDVGSGAGQNPPVPVPDLESRNREQDEDGDSELFPERQGTGREQVQNHACSGEVCRYCAEVSA